MLKRAWSVAWLFAVGACGVESGTGTGTNTDSDTGPNDGSSRDVGASASDNSDAGAPAVCVDESVVSAASNEQDCARTELSDWGGRFVCGWALVTTFSNVATCAVASVEGRCEAYLATENVDCHCAAYPTEWALVESPCVSYAGHLSGPIDENYFRRGELGEPYLCARGSASSPDVCACLQACER